MSFVFVVHLHTSSGSIPRSHTERGHGAIIFLVMARVRQNDESSSMHSKISYLPTTLPRWLVCTFALVQLVLVNDPRSILRVEHSVSSYLTPDKQGYLAHKKPPPP